MNKKLVWSLFLALVSTLASNSLKCSDKVLFLVKINKVTLTSVWSVIDNPLIKLRFKNKVEDIDVQDVIEKNHTTLSFKADSFSDVQNNPLVVELYDKNHDDTNKPLDKCEIKVTEEKQAIHKKKLDLATIWIKTQVKLDNDGQYKPTSAALNSKISSISAPRGIKNSDISRLQKLVAEKNRDVSESPSELPSLLDKAKSCLYLAIISDYNNENILTAYFIVSASPFWNKMLNSSLNLKEDKFKVRFIELSPEFEHKGIESLKDKAQYFMQELSHCTDDLSYYQFFPCKKEFIEEYANNFSNFKINHWNELKDFIDLTQMNPKLDSIYSIIENKLSNNNEALKYLNSYDKSKLTPELQSLFASINKEFQNRVVRVKSLNGNIYLYLKDISFTLNLNYQTSLGKSIKEITEEINGIDPDLLVNQPVTAIEWGKNDTSSIIFVASTHCYLTNISSITLDTAPLLASILKLNFKIIEGRFKVKTLKDKLEIDIPDSDFDSLFKAFTHCTYSDMLPQVLTNYESLEFLGDAVLSPICAYYLLMINFNESIDKIAEKYDCYTCNSYLTKVADKHNISFAILIPKLDLDSKVKADVVEAILGAVFSSLYNLNSDKKLDLLPVHKFCIRYILEKSEDCLYSAKLPVIPKSLIIIPEELLEKLDVVERRLNYKFENKFLLIEALAFSDCFVENSCYYEFIDNIKFIQPNFDNKRLKFMGASLLKLIITFFIYNQDSSMLPKEYDVKVHNILQNRKIPGKLNQLLKEPPFCLKFNGQRTLLVAPLVGAVYFDNPNLYRTSYGIDVRNNLVKRLFLYKYINNQNKE